MNNDKRDPKILVESEGLFQPGTVHDIAGKRGIIFYKTMVQACWISKMDRMRFLLTFYFRGVEVEGMCFLFSSAASVTSI